jgi:hypothetical protein
MSRAAAIARAHAYFDSGEFLADLRRRVAIPSTSQEPERVAALRLFLDKEMDDGRRVGWAKSSAVALRRGHGARTILPTRKF